MTTANSPLLTPFAKLSGEEQIELSNKLFFDLETLIIQGRSDEISELRKSMKDKYGMESSTFQLYLEEIYNVQVQTILDPNGNEVDKLKVFLTAVPITIFPDYDIEETLFVDSYLGPDCHEWAQEVIATMVNHGYLRAGDQHYVSPMLFDARDLYETPDKAFKLISETINGDISLSYPPKKIVLTKDHASETRFLIVATGCRNLDEKTAIVPPIHDCFTEFADMQQDIESIVAHYWNERAIRDGIDLGVSYIVGAPMEAASSVRIKLPSELMAKLAYHIQKNTHEVDPKQLKVIVERNKEQKTLGINLYISNTCVMSFAYPKQFLSDGFELAMIGYVLDTSNLASYRVVDTNETINAKKKIEQPLLRVVK